VNSKILFPTVKKNWAQCSELDVQAQQSVTEFNPMTYTNLAITVEIRNNILKEQLNIATTFSNISNFISSQLNHKT
jgi:hypothetical protein